MLTLSDLQIQGNTIFEMLDSSFVFAATVTNSRIEGLDIPASTNEQPIFQFKVGTNLYLSFSLTHFEISQIELSVRRIRTSLV